MLGPAELRLIDEHLDEIAPAEARSARRSPYISPHFAAGVAAVRAVAGGVRRLRGAEKPLPANDLP